MGAGKSAQLPPRRRRPPCRPYELDGDTLRIWAGEKGSPAFFEGTFLDGDAVMAGAWVHPGGGGDESTLTRVRGRSS